MLVSSHQPMCACVRACVCACVLSHSVCTCREMSMCQIKIEEAKPDRSDRVITIIGTPNNVHYAQELLQEK